MLLGNEFTPTNGADLFSLHDGLRSDASGLLVPHGVWHDRIYTERQDYLLRVFHPPRAVIYDGFPRWVSACHSVDRAHIEDALRHNGHGSASRLFRIFGVQQGLGRTSHSVVLPAWHVLHRNAHPSVWDNQDRNKAVSVVSASSHLHWGIGKALTGLLP